MGKCTTLISKYAKNLKTIEESSEFEINYQLNPEYKNIRDKNKLKLK